MCGVVFGDRPVVAVEEMADAGVAADQDELARGRAGAEFLEQPEQALHRHVHDVVRRFLAGGEMDDMGDAGHRRFATTSRSAIEPRDHLDAVGFVEQVGCGRARGCGRRKSADRQAGER